MLNFPAGSDQSARVQDRSTTEEKSENKNLEYISTEEKCVCVCVCDTPQNDGVWSSHFHYIDDWQNSLN